ncbi:CHAT domain-containing protein [Streptomyces sp. NBC_00160]|uniref:CHAT domain-containing protein n=1 Tax=Streptomyces sp. NBC_00160 TaxID=2903628 RepID=UPI00224CA96C|nr:CHAT domain-containing protein [Streptomyces sp. NBC_00160]MCX5303093.1 CHAT domain-containing protein [Streptomyces sp. NBC_00160]
MISIALIANLERNGVTQQHSLIICRLAKLLSEEERFEFFESLLGAIVSEPHCSCITRKDGLYYIYIEAADSAFRLRRRDLALTWCCAAWELVDSLADNPRDARARLTGRIRFATYLAYSSRDLVARLETDAHVGIERELHNVLRFIPADGRLLQLQAALARAPLVRTVDHLRLRGRITAAEERVGFLQRAVTDAFGVAFTDGLFDVTTLGVGDGGSSSKERKEREALTKVLVELALAYSRMGDDRRVSWYVYATRRFASSQRHLLDATIASGLGTTDLAQTVRICEDFTRAHVSGSLAEMKDHQYSRVLGRYSSVALKLANMLKTNQEYSGAAFWQLQAEFWRLEKQDLADRWTGEASGSDEQMVTAYIAHLRELEQRPGRFSSVDEDARADGSVGNGAGTVLETISQRAQDIERLVAEEDVNKIISLLRDAGLSTEVAIDTELARAIHEALTTVIAWRPHLFEAVAPDSLDRSQGASLGPLCLRVATVLARRYLPHRTIALLLDLSQRPELEPIERLDCVNEARVAALDQGRFALALRSFRYWLRLPDELRGTVSDEQIAETLSDLLGRSDRSTEQLGISGVFDRAFALAVELADLAETLVESGRHRLAFHASALAQSRITWALEQNPESVEELNHAIKVRAADGELDLYRFHATVLNRVCSTSGASLAFQTLAEIRQADDDHDDTAAVRVLGPSSGHVWAIGRAAATYFAVPLSTTAMELTDLAGAAWFWMGDRGNPEARDHVFRELWDTCVAPLWPRLSGAARVTFAFHDKIPFLPLHGALGPDGFLGVTLPVDYEIQPGVSRPPVPAPSAASPEAAVLGWDPRTVSDREVVAVTGVIGDAFTLVPAGDVDSAVTDIVLNPDRKLAVLHIAGHGELLSYPHAMHSAVELAPSVKVTAYDLVTSGCRSRFVFLNVCSVGHSVTTAGDSYGFALAVRSRGAQAFLAPATYIEPEDAKTFATLFYAAALHQDTARAVHQVVRELDASGAMPAAWMPYALFGRLPSLL